MSRLPDSPREACPAATMVARVVRRCAACPTIDDPPAAVQKLIAAMRSPRHSTTADRKRKRLLLITFAYAEGAGSEAGVGYNLATELSRVHDVTVITDRARPGTPPDPEPGMGRPRVVRLGLRWWPRALDPMTSKPRLEAYYYFWLRMMADRLPALVQASGADLVQHITYCRYWMPSAVDTAGRPFVWGPVGGGESASRRLLATSGLRVRVPAWLRESIRSIFERDPRLARTAAAASLGIGTTPESAERMRTLTSAPVRVLPSVTLDARELDRLARVAAMPEGGIRFMSIGRMLHWKGFDLAIEAFARHADEDWTYDIVGDGPERDRLEQRVRQLGMGDRVRFLGLQTRDETLSLLGTGHVLVHPSMHDSGGMVCLEAMAAGRPVICLEGNGPAHLCGDTALTVPMTTRDEVITGLSRAMKRLADDRSLLAALGSRAAAHVRAHHASSHRAATLATWFDELWERSSLERRPDRVPAAPPQVRHAFTAGMKIRR